MFLCYLIILYEVVVYCSSYTIWPKIRLILKTNRIRFYGFKVYITKTLWSTRQWQLNYQLYWVMWRLPLIFFDFYYLIPIEIVTLFPHCKLCLLWTSSKNVSIKKNRFWYFNYASVSPHSVSIAAHTKFEAMLQCCLQVIIYHVFTIVMNRRWIPWQLIVIRNCHQKRVEQNVSQLICECANNTTRRIVCPSWWSRKSSQCLTKLERSHWNFKIRLIKLWL